MAPTSKKRRKPPSSIASKSSDSDIETTEHAPQAKGSTNPVLLYNSDDDVPSTDVGQSQGLTDAQELKRELKISRNQQSDCYASFNPLELLVQLDKHKCHKIAYPSVEVKDTHKLGALGVSGSLDIDAREVPQLCAIWCAEGVHLFAALGERAHCGILHPEVVKHLPNQRVVSSDIIQLYTAVQESFIKQLEKHTGAMYLGLDAWQLPNCYDVLGTVIYYLVKGDTERHTGVYLADTVRVIVEKFGLENTICGIVTDNASNKETMIEEIRRFKWPRFKGKTHWVRCFTHTLNLIAQVIIRPLGSHKKNKTNCPLLDEDENSEDKNDEEIEDADEQIRGFSRQVIEVSEDEENNGDSPLATNLIDEGKVKLEMNDVVDLSDKGEDDDYTSQSCKQTLTKFQAIARKLNKSPN
ncbi:hypothetical protein PSTG_10867 [Puccinia striiformis f. sp. tritici PST-78]|uniref:DUF659 domain-containing protein n=1 Tax=Puccinia striiformis f. sp. tritici PST-78 TaxID=1165861 RepID=A0A0L0V940_9BASI|nr:hypothetical protein PSTG_10867 [Puccinia striiformis f. sp. tritici PST-78]